MEELLDRPKGTSF